MDHHKDMKAAVEEGRNSDVMEHMPSEAKGKAIVANGGSRSSREGEIRVQPSAFNPNMANRITENAARTNFHDFAARFHGAPKSSAFSNQHASTSGLRAPNFPMNTSDQWYEQAYAELQPLRENLPLFMRANEIEQQYLLPSRFFLENVVRFLQISKAGFFLVPRKEAQVKLDIIKKYIRYIQQRIDHINYP